MSHRLKDGNMQGQCLTSCCLYIEVSVFNSSLVDVEREDDVGLSCMEEEHLGKT